MVKLNIASVEGDTITKMRESVLKTGLYGHGDCRLAWINESDLFLMMVNGDVKDWSTEKHGVIVDTTLTADYAKVLPGNVIDDADYAAIEDALDSVDAPMVDGDRWLTLAERIVALGKLRESK